MSINFPKCLILTPSIRVLEWTLLTINAVFLSIHGNTQNKKELVLLDDKERFLLLCSAIHRDGIDNLMSWLESSDFYTAPASTRYHGSHTGGLLAHSLNVYDELKRLLTAYPEVQATEETVAIVALFHDLCKVNFYATEKRNRKNEDGRWESYDAYTIKEKFCFGGHGSKSVFIVQNFIKLTPEEAVAINCHMGSFDNQNVGQTYEQFPLAWVLHVADEAATYIQEAKQD